MFNKNVKARRGKVQRAAWKAKRRRREEGKQINELFGEIIETVRSQRREQRKGLTMTGNRQQDASALPNWVALWLIVSGTICTYDVAYTMNRPYTNDPASPMADRLFGGWALYSSVDRHYLTTDDVFTCSTGRVMLLECLLNFLAVGLAFAHSRHAILLAFTSNVMVLWKTILFFSMFLWQPDGHTAPMNPNKTVWSKFMIFWIPNGVWVVMPTLVLLALWNKLALPPAMSEKYWEASNEYRGDLDFEDKDKKTI